MRKFTIAVVALLVTAGHAWACDDAASVGVVQAVQEQTIVIERAEEKHETDRAICRLDPLQRDRRCD